MVKIYLKRTGNFVLRQTEITLSHWLQSNHVTWLYWL